MLFFTALRNPNRTKDAQDKQPSRDVIPFMSREEMEREREKKRKAQKEREEIWFEESD
jgi:hypothetical protein